MHVSGFMTPQAKVATCWPTDTLKLGLDEMLNKGIGSLVVLMKENETAQEHIPIGIVTKTDFMKAYMKGMPLTTPVRDIMSKDLVTIRENVPRDQAARVFERNKSHHCVVVGEDGVFKGIISAWDIVAECVRDDRAWPWIRNEDGKFHTPTETKQQPQSPRATAEHPHDEPMNIRESHAFLDYVDSIREMPFMDD